VWSTLFPPQSVKGRALGVAVFPDSE
jgi:hypothetical protein